MTQEELISGLRSGIVLAGLDYLEPVLDRLEEQLQTVQRERHEAVEDALRLGAFSGKDEAVAEVERLKEQLEAAQARLHAEQRDRNWWAANNSRDRQLDALQLTALRRVAQLIVEYEPGERGATLRYIQEQARGALGSGAIEPAMSFQWLIERGQPEGLSRAIWLEHSLNHPARDRVWTTIAHEAAMFPDRETAEGYIADEGLQGRAVEHGFMSEASTPATEPDA